MYAMATATDLDPAAQIHAPPSVGPSVDVLHLHALAPPIGSATHLRLPVDRVRLLLFAGHPLEKSKQVDDQAVGLGVDVMSLRLPNA